MKAAVMQPYLFPYLGYYQLVYFSDIFVVYDDASFINRGFVNRNYILFQGDRKRITIPVPGASQNKLIKDLSFSRDVSKVLETIRHSYCKSPYFSEVFDLVNSVLNNKNRGVVEVCEASISWVFDYLGINKKIMKSSDLLYNRNLPAEEKIISICQELGASHYINSPNGKSLYSKYSFERSGIDLDFLRTSDVSYDQGLDYFVPNLSIVDVLMWCSPEDVRGMLNKFELE